MRDMRSLAAEAVEQGAFALSTGLTFAPSSYATTDELVSLVEAISPYEGAFYVSHARLWANEHVKAVEECVEIGRGAGVPVQYSHMAIVDSRNFGDGPSMVGVIDRARDEGMDVTYDMYPYTAAGTGLDQLVPEWLQEGGVPSMLQRLRDPQLRQRAREDLEKYGWFRGLPFVWESLVLSEISTDANQGLVGLSVGEVAEQRKADPYDTMLDLMDEEDNRVAIVMHNRTESDIRFFLGHEAAMIGSDGNAISPTGRQSVDQPHPRFYGTYPRVLGRYVREQPSVLSLEAAVRKMTGLPAERLTLKDRGLIAEGLVADLVLFDADTVIDRATFEDPHQYPVGIPYVFVNGTAVVDGGVHTGARPGRVLRRGA
jgi:N-acyl-D-aspartate/D-glutamate deacylase